MNKIITIMILILPLLASSQIFDMKVTPKGDFIFYKINTPSDTILKRIVPKGPYFTYRKQGTIKSIYVNVDKELNYIVSNTFGNKINGLSSPDAAMLSIESSIGVNYFGVRAIHGGLPALGIREMYINNLIIDGNENENTEAVSWRINYDIDVSNSRHFSITNSEFYNCPTNCITGGPSIYAANIKGKRILGSLFHQSNAGISNGTNQYGGGIYNSKHFTNIEIDDIGEKWVELEHDAAIFTASANTYDFFISDSRFTNVKSAFVEVGSSGGMYNINNVFVSASDLSTPHLIFGGISNVNYEEGKVKITNSGIYENI